MADGGHLTELRATSLEGDIGPDGGHPEAITGRLTVPVTPSEDSDTVLTPSAVSDSGQGVQTRRSPQPADAPGRDQGLLTALLDVPAETYHADQLGERPTLSCSILKILLNASPAHAKAAHPRLNPNYEKRDDSKFDLGTAAHAVFFEGQANMRVIFANDWRSKSAQEERDEARAFGQIPLLDKDAQRCEQIVEALTDQIADVNAQPPLFDGGKAEQTLLWEDRGVACKARLDWLRDDYAAIDDLKTTSRLANPEQWSRQLFNLGYDLQAAFYLRGLEAVTNQRAQFRLVVIETAPPFAMSVLALSSGALELANAKIDKALAVWRACLEADTWPAYPALVATVEPPAWAESQWLEREAREEMVA